jgi:hypothetical protein
MVDEFGSSRKYSTRNLIYAASFGPGGPVPSTVLGPGSPVPSTVLVVLIEQFQKGKN